MHKIVNNSKGNEIKPYSQQRFDWTNWFSHPIYSNHLPTFCSVLQLSQSVLSTSLRCRTPPHRPSAPTPRPLLRQAGCIALRCSTPGLCSLWPISSTTSICKTRSSIRSACSMYGPRMTSLAFTATPEICCICNSSSSCRSPGLHLSFSNFQTRPTLYPTRYCRTTAQRTLCKSCRTWTASSQTLTSSSQSRLTQTAASNTQTSSNTSPTRQCLRTRLSCSCWMSLNKK